MSELYALLIGLDFYFEYPLPDGSYYPRLGGCVRDISHVASYLTDPAGLNLPSKNLLTLTATNNQAQLPVETHENWPTYENMVAKFKQLAGMAQAGDQVYIHYSGHGGRATTIYADLKGDSAVDEAIVPLDIGAPQARYLRDVELYYLINDMVKKGLHLTVVFDSCHSGGATRGAGGARKRGISVIDTAPRPTESLVAPLAALTATWQAATAGATRGSNPASGWLLEPKGYTFFAACRANESAFEYPFNGRESNGALTYWLLDSLRQAGPESSYKMVYDRILGKVHGQFEQQTPLLQGEGDLRVFGSERIQPFYAVEVIEVDDAGKRVRLQAGEAHGIAMGSQFAIYPVGTIDFSATAKRIAQVEVSQVNEVDCWANILSQTSAGVLEVGAQALLLKSADLRLQRDVLVVVDDAGLKQQIEAAIASQGNGFVAVAAAGKSDFQVAIGDNKTYQLWDAAGAPLPNLRPAIGVNEPDAITRLVQRLVHLAKYYNVRDLASPDASGAQKLQVTLTPSSGATEKGAGSTPLYKPHDKVRLVVKNTQTPGAADDPAGILNITVLDLASDWSITQIFPQGASLFEPLDPQGSFAFEFEALLPDGSSEGSDTVKVFATQSTTSFRWLQLPAVDQPVEAIARGTIHDPLEALLASVTADTAPTRAIRIISSPQIRTWTTAQVELHIKG